MSLYHSTFGNLQNGRDGRERNFQKDLMVLNRNYTDTRGEAVSAIEDADLMGQSEKPVAILAPVFSTMHTIWIV